MHPEGLSGHEPTTASSFFPTPPRLRIFDASSQVAGLSRTFSDPHVELVRKSDAKPIDFCAVTVVNVVRATKLKIIFVNFLIVF